MKWSLSKILFLSLIAIFAIMYFVVIYEGNKIRVKKRAELKSLYSADKSNESLLEAPPRHE